MLRFAAMPQRKPEFLNVDLDLESGSALGRLIDALPSMIVMFSARMRGKHVLSMELSVAGLSLDQTLRRMAKMISRLSGEPRQLWRRTTKRSFNIGLASGGHRGPAFAIQSPTIQAIASVGGSVEITVYPPAKQAGLTRSRILRRKRSMS
jgi:hypothetical protein